MLGWHEDFCRKLADAGFYVVRFDNRDVGHSTHVQGPPPTARQLLTRSRSAARYRLADMADDAAALLAQLDLAPAHVIGASMGGMIAQTLAARHPQAVRSLVSIMSSTGRLTSGQPSLRLYSLFLRAAPREREAFVAHMERVFTGEMRCVGLVYPTQGIAQDAGMTLRQFEDFYWGTLLVDWDALAESIRRIADRFDAGSEVRIVGDGTDLRFSLAGRQGLVDALGRTCPGARSSMSGRGLGRRSHQLLGVSGVLPRPRGRRRPLPLRRRADRGRLGDERRGLPPRDARYR
jgi:pimeloyl-ACP methyl ester carboxylesterase